MILNSDLEGKTVFLSASYPQPGVLWPKEYTALDQVRIGQGVKALLKAVFMRRGKIVFGGHPTITPFVIDVAEGFTKYYDDAPFVFIYQSKFFAEEYPEEAKHLRKQAFASFVETSVQVGTVSEAATPQEKKIATLMASLEEMRTRMFEEQSPVFGVFIGGKDGIVKEFDLLHEVKPKARLYPIATSGGAASLLLDAESNHSRLSLLRDLGLNDQMINALREGKGMPFICDKIVRDYIESIK